MVFVYLLLSLICTALNEGFSSLLNKRGQNLFEGVKNLLNDPQFTGLAQQIYNHGMIDGITREETKPPNPFLRFLSGIEKFLTREPPGPDVPQGLPSYMPTGHFALALLDILGARGIIAAAHGVDLAAAEAADDAFAASQTPTNPNGDSALQQAAETARAKLVDTVTTAEKAAKTADDAFVASKTPAIPNGDPKLQEAADQAKTAAAVANAAVKMLDARRAAIVAASNPRNAQLVQKAATTLELALAAGRNFAASHPDPLSNIQTAVERLPEGHTKETLFVLLDKTRREAATLEFDVVKVEHQVEKFQENLEDWFNDAMDRVTGWYKRWTQAILLGFALFVVVMMNADSIMLIQSFSNDKDLRAAVAQAAQRITANQTNLDTVRETIQKETNALQLPLGWSMDWNDARHIPGITEYGYDNYSKGELFRIIVGGWILKILGLAISIFAVSMGAPFWFDTLSKFVNLRGAGTPPGETKKSAPQPKTVT